MAHLEMESDGEAYLNLYGPESAFTALSVFARPMTRAERRRARERDAERADWSEP